MYILIDSKQIFPFLCTFANRYYLCIYANIMHRGLVEIATPQVILGIIFQKRAKLVWKLKVALYLSLYILYCLNYF